jgi:hypothetical protein
MTRIELAWRAACCAVVAIGLSGCMNQRVGDLTLVSSKNVDLTYAHLDARQGQRVVGKDCKWAFLGIPTGTPSLKDAIDNALEKGNTNLMVDEVTRLQTQNYVIVGKTCYVVEGTALSVSSRQ